MFLTAWTAGCASRGHIATPAEMAMLREAGGLSASGRLTLSGPEGRLSAPLVFGVARPDSLRIEIPAGVGLRFLLIAKDGRLRAELPQDDAMFEGPATRAIMNGLFGIDLSASDLAGALLGSPPEALSVGWRFDRTLPRQMTVRGGNDTRLAVTLDEPETRAPGEEAFQFGPPRRHVWSLQEMSARLGLRR